MVTKVYNFFYNGVGATANLVNNQITQRCLIVGYSLDLSIAAVAAQTEVAAELSFVSAVQTNVNGVLGPICSISGRGAFTAAGTGLMTFSKSLYGLMIPANAGDVIYLNVTNANATTYSFYAKIYANQS